MSPLLTSNSSTCRWSLGFGSRGPRSTSLSGPTTAVIAGSSLSSCRRRTQGRTAALVSAARRGADGAVVEADHPLVSHPDGAPDPGHPTDDIYSSVAGG